MQPLSIEWIPGEKRAEFPRCFRTLVVKIEKTNSNSTRDFSKRINFTRVDPFVWSTLVVKIKKTQESTPSVKENIILLPVDSPLSGKVANIDWHEISACAIKTETIRPGSQISKISLSKIAIH